MEPRRLTAELFFRYDCVLGEGPFWFEQKIWWVDIERGLLLAIDDQRASLESWSVGQRIGSAVPVSSGTFVLALEKSVTRFNLRTGRQTYLSEAELPAGHRFNDGKCDPVGRFLVGTLDMQGSSGNAALYVQESGQPLRLLRKGVSLSNGLAWSKDGRTLYHIDTTARRVSAYDYDVGQGTISGERTILNFDEELGLPDGMTIDQQGHLWIAFWDGWAVRCYRPSDGTCLIEVEVPCARPTSCCFGGPEMDRLFITTARQGLSEAELREQPLAGSLFSCLPGTTGLGTARFS